MTRIEKTQNGYSILLDGKEYARIPSMEGATDRFEPIEDRADAFKLNKDFAVFRHGAQDFAEGGNTG